MFEPNWISPPGNTILQLINQMGTSEETITRNLYLSNNEFQQLVNGEIRINVNLARALEKHLGYDETFWLKRDSLFFQRKVQLEKQWAESFPLSSMMKRGLLIHKSNNLIQSLFNFFGVSNIMEWDSIYGRKFKGLAFRKSQALESDIYSISAWVREAEIQVKNMNVSTWDVSLLEERLGDLKELTREKKVEVFLPRLIKICSECGVKVAIVKNYGKNAASGATKFSKGSPIIILSFRHISDDHFWFTFFHEIGHLILHGHNLLKNNLWIDDQCAEEENEANIFSEEILVGKIQSELKKTTKTPRAILSLSQLAGVSPGIIIGQMQHKGYIKYEHYNKYKKTFDWSEINSALESIFEKQLST